MQWSTLGPFYEPYEPKVQFGLCICQDYEPDWLVVLEAVMSEYDIFFCNIPVQFMRDIYEVMKLVFFCSGDVQFSFIKSCKSFGS